MDERAQAALAQMIRAVVGRDLDELHARIDELEQRPPPARAKRQRG
jgi:hypothetical protein